MSFGTRGHLTPVQSRQVDGGRNKTEHGNILLRKQPFNRMAGERQDWIV